MRPEAVADSVTATVAFAFSTTQTPRPPSPVSRERFQRPIVSLARNIEHVRLFKGENVLMNSSVCLFARHKREMTEKKC